MKLRHGVVGRELNGFLQRFKGVLNAARAQQNPAEGVPARRAARVAGDGALRHFQRAVNASAAFSVDISQVIERQRMLW